MIVADTSVWIDYFRVILFSNQRPLFVGFVVFSSTNHLILLLNQNTEYREGAGCGLDAFLGRGDQHKSAVHGLEV